MRAGEVCKKGSHPGSQDVEGTGHTFYLLFLLFLYSDVVTF